MKSIEMWWIRWDFSYDVPPQSYLSNPRRRAGDIAGEAWECEAQTAFPPFWRMMWRGKTGRFNAGWQAFMAPGLSIRALAGREPMTSIEASFKVSNNQSLWVCILCSSSQPPWKWSIQVFLHMQCLPSMYIIWGCLRNGARACIARHGQRASCTISHVPYKFPSFTDLSQIWKASVDKLIWHSWNPRLQQPVAHVSLLVHSRCTRPIEQKGWAASFIGRVWGLKDSRMRSVKSAPTSRCKRVCFSRGTRDRSGAEQLRVFLE